MNSVNKPNRTPSVSFVVFVIAVLLSIVLSLGVFVFAGKQNNNDNIESFSNYLKVNNVSLSWNDKDRDLTISRNNATIRNVKDFKWIRSLDMVNGKLIIALNDDGFNKQINNLLYGTPLRSEFDEIKVIVNNLEDISITTEKAVSDLYTQYYPYTIKICDIDNDLYLFESSKVCDGTTHLTLVIDTFNKKSIINIDYYKEWDNIVDRFMVYNKMSLETKLKLFRDESTKVKSTYEKAISKIKLNKIINANTLMIGGVVKKTKETLNTQLLVIEDKKEDYIEKNIGETNYFVSFDKNQIETDINYIISTLSPDVVRKPVIKVNEEVPKEPVPTPVKPIEKETNPIDSQKNEEPSTIPELKLSNTLKSDNN